MIGRRRKWMRDPFRRGRSVRLRKRVAPASATVSRDIERQFETAPYAELVESVAQVILDDLLGGADHVGNFAIGLVFPNQHCNLIFLGGQSIRVACDSLCSLW